ncbi:MAG: hypothetical protein KKD35_04460 [Elusimicrobia bacterium]|nr:hypothetical protein [Elusimicrobiota bacterium]
MVRQLLMFCRKDMVRMETLNINEIIRESVKMLKSIIGERINVKMYI